MTEYTGSAPKRKLNKKKKNIEEIAKPICLKKTVHKFPSEENGSYNRLQDEWLQDFSTSRRFYVEDDNGGHWIKQ